jgi:thiosulfate/3-mercaptopyruvate sulfurtransferase
MNLVSTKWLSKNLGKVKIIDSSWHLKKDRNALAEYKKQHIENAIFFDLDKVSNQSPILPHNHFLPKKEQWERQLSQTGISNNSTVVIYDHSDLISSCRIWFQFRYFGHNSDLIFVLNGGLKSWLLENRKVTDKKTNILPSKYVAKENKNMIKNKSQIKKNIKTKAFKVLDARSKNRFLGLEPEPRPNVKSGHIKNSKSLPFNELINKENNTFLDKKNLKKKFNLAGVNNLNIVATCGSSVSAATLTLAYSIINSNYVPKIYIGSWSEYGKIS